MEFWPQYTYLFLLVLGIGMSISTHGQPRRNENAISTLISSALVFFIMYQGGFFKGM